MSVTALLVLVCVVACYVLSVRQPGRFRWLPEGPSRSSWAWSIFFAMLLAFLAVYSAAGLVDVDVPSAIISSIALGVCAVAELWNSRVRATLSGLPGLWPLVAEALILLVGSYLTFVAIELPSNPYMTSFWWEGLLFEITIILIVMTILHFVFQRSGLGAAIAAILFEVAGIAEYFVVTFKDAPIMASDILSLGTAATVAGGYTYTLSSQVIMSIALVGAVVVLLSFTPAPRSGAHRGRAVAANIGVAVAMAAAVTVGCFTIDFARDFNIVFNAWIPLTSYYREGFVSSFVTQVQSFRPQQPKGYSNEEAESMLDKYASEYDQTIGAQDSRTAAVDQWNEEPPCVVVVMNESFADLSIYDDLAGTYEGPQWFNSFDGALAKGTLYVSPYGGGTCNSEWEFLAGASMGFMGSGVYPYMVYDMTGVDNLAATFKSMGYQTTAMHPNLATNWYRNVVYPTFGFDQFLDLSDFTGAERYRNMVSDKATYDKIIDQLKSSDDPQFIFDVTMQNHGGYDTGVLSPDLVTQRTVVDYDNPELDEYLALIDISDKALGDFVDELCQLDRRVVLVFFGDHQPSIASFYNNWLMTSDPDDITHEERARTTDYMIYANYDVAGTQTTGDKTDMSTNFLAADMMNMVGAPLTDYQKAELVMHNTNMPLLNLLGYQDSHGAWYPIDSKEDSGASLQRDDLQYLQYHQLFADGVHYQTGAGYSGTVFGRLQ